MGKLWFFLPAALLLGTGWVACSGATSGPTPAAIGGEDLVYPISRTVDQIDTYHGVDVADPYRWLEEDNPGTRSWIDAQDELLQSYLEPVEQMESLEERLLKIRNFESFSLPQKKHGKLFYTRIEAGAKHGSLYEEDALGGKPRRILSFADVITDSGHALAGFTISEDGRHVVWASLSQAGWGWLDVARLDTGVVAKERIQGVGRNSAIWTHDGLGFFYLHVGDYEALEAGIADARHELYYHRLGTEPSSDTLVYSRKDQPALILVPKISSDGRYLVIGLYDGDPSRNSVIYRDLESRDGTFRDLIPEADAAYVFEGNEGSWFFFQTTLDAPRGRLMALDLQDPRRSQWTEVIPEREAPLASVSHIAGRFLVVSTVHARPVVEQWTLEGTLKSTLELPALGLVSGFADDPEGRVAFFRMNSLHDPGTVYRLDMETGRSSVQLRPHLSHDPEDYEIKQVFYRGKDGTRIPMFLAHRKDVPLLGDRPLFMYGYGHAGWVAFPWFQPHLVAWMDLGGTYALPGLRGGGEYGSRWQEAGTRLQKPTTIDDFVAAAEWLIRQGYTSPTKLVANGGSASGVVPAAAALRRPDLFAAAVIDFPFLDMLRYHHFNRIKGWTRGYGSSEDPEEFEVLRSYSPLHNLRPGGCYPAMLTIVGEEDTATPPLHGYKFTAAFQAAQGCHRPGLLKFVPGAGHYTYGITPQAAARTEAQMLGFLIRSLGLEG